MVVVVLVQGQFSNFKKHIRIYVAIYKSTKRPRTELVKYQVRSQMQSKLANRVKELHNTTYTKLAFMRNDGRQQQLLY